MKLYLTLFFIIPFSFTRCNSFLPEQELADLDRKECHYLDSTFTETTSINPIYEACTRYHHARKTSGITEIVYRNKKAFSRTGYSNTKDSVKLGVQSFFYANGKLAEVFVYDKDEHLKEHYRFNKKGRNSSAYVYRDNSHPKSPNLDSVEVNAHFPNGERAMLTYIKNHLRIPRGIKMEKVSGQKLNISFIIEKTGRVSSVETMNSVHPLLDQESIRVVNSMPDWIPALNNRWPVRQKFRIPIRF